VGEIDYSEVTKEAIKGLLSFQMEEEDGAVRLQNLFVDQSGHFFRDSVEVEGSLAETKWGESRPEELFKVLGNHVHCMESNPHR